MVGVVLATAWAGLAAGQNSGLASEGRALFTRYCSIPYCHGSEGGEGRAPTLRGRTRDPGALRDIVVNGIPDTSMPDFGERLTENEVDAVVAYVLSISIAPPPEAGASVPSREAKPVSVEIESLPASRVGVPERGATLFSKCPASVDAPGVIIWAEAMESDRTLRRRRSGTLGHCFATSCSQTLKTPTDLRSSR